MRRGWFLVLVLLGSAPFLPAQDVRADDLASETGDTILGAEAAREELIRTAQDQVTPGDSSVGGLDELERATQAQRPMLEAAFAAAPETEERVVPRPLARMDALVGTLPEGPGGDREGLIRQGARLYRWVTGGLEAAEREPPDERLPTFAVLAPEADVELGTLPAVRPESLPEEVRALLLEGRLAIRRPEGVIGLHGIEELAAVRDATGSHRHALVAPDELGWIVSRDFLGWRRAQKEVRARLDGAHAQGLVNDAEVEAKWARVTRLREELERYETLAERIRNAWVRSASAEGTGPDMRASERHWVDAADQLEVRVEALRKDEAQAQALARMEFEARVVQQEQRLLYITVLRAAERLAVLEELITLVEGEVGRATASHQTFVSAANRLRRERQLVSLRNQARELDQAKEVLARRGDASPERRALYDALRTVTEDLQELVRIRRHLEQGVTYIPDPSGAPAAEDAAPAATTPDAEATATPTEPPPAHGLPADLQRPASQSLGREYVARARSHLDHPGFDEGIVAAHHAAADDVLRALRAARSHAQALPDVAARLTTHLAEAQDAMASARAADYVLQRYRDMLPRMETTRRVTLEGIEAVRSQVSTRIGLLEAWQEDLLGLGLRSLTIRVDRTLTWEGLEAAADDAGRGTQAAVDWVTGEGDAHAGTWLSRHGMPLLAWLGCLVAGVVLVVFLRRRIDVALTRLADGVPWLRTATITVKAEAARVKAHQAAAEAARRDAEASALKDAAGATEAAPAPEQPEEEGR